MIDQRPEDQIRDRSHERLTFARFVRENSFPREIANHMAMRLGPELTGELKYAVDVEEVQIDREVDVFSREYCRTTAQQLSEEGRRANSVLGGSHHANHDVESLPCRLCTRACNSWSPNPVNQSP